MRKKILLFDEIPFRPTLYKSDLKLWLDAADTSSIAESGGAVSQWNDKSGNGNHATQGTGANQPTTGSNTLNGKNVITFDSSSDYLIANAVASVGTGDHTIFVVTTPTAQTDAGVITAFQNGEGEPSGNQGKLEVNTSEQVQYTIDSATVLETRSLQDTPFIGTITVSSTAVNGRIDGVVTSGSPASHTRASTLSQFSIGQEYDGASTPSNFYGGDIAEIIIYSRILSTTEIAKVESYLAAKWNISITAPLSLAPALWLDAADTNTITESSGSVSQWNDKSGNDYHVTQGTGSEQPTTNATIQNGRNVIDFDGGDSLILPSALYAIPQGENTMYIVSKRSSEDGTIDVVLGMGESGVANRYFILYALVVGIIEYRSNNGTGTVANVGNTNTDFNIIGGYRSGTTMNIVVNGSQTTSTLGANASTVNFARVGLAAAGSLSFTGSIAEIIIFSRALSSTERTAVETYLAAKWGITLS